MPIKKDQRISRLRLSLTLGSPLRGGFPVGGEEEQQKLVSAGSEWTLSAAPSTASAYSQESYTLSPVPFRSAKVDKRRFALALESANWEEGWSAPIRDPQSPVGTFVLDLHSATLAPEEDDFFDKSEETLLKKADADEVKEPAVPIKNKEHSVTETNKEVISKEAPRSKTQKPRSKSVFGKWFSKRPAQPSPDAIPESPQEDDQPLLSSFPPRIEITVPSPGIKGVHDLPESDITPAELVKSLQSASIPGNRATMPSGWKPHRPPSPIPRILKKSSKKAHKRGASSVSVTQVHSPIPPLPTLPIGQPISPTPNAEPDYERLELSGRELFPAMQDQNSRKSLWRDSLQVRVKARAMKSAYYAPVPEDIFSPPSSAV